MTEQNSLEPRRYSFSSNALEPAASPRSPELPSRAGARHFHGKKSKTVHQGKNLWLQRESILASHRRMCDQKGIHRPPDFCEAGLFKRPVYEPNDLVAEIDIVVVKEAKDTELVVDKKKEAKRQEQELDDEGKEEVELQVRQEEKEEEQSLKEEEIKVDEEEAKEEEEEENHNGEAAPKLALFHNNICEGRCDPFPPVEV